MIESRSGYVQLVVGALLISFSAVFVRQANLSPTIAAFYRALFGALFLAIVVAVRRDAIWRGRRPLLLGAAAAGFLAADLSLWHRSILSVGPGLATLLANFQVFFLAGAGALIFKERLGKRFLVALPVAVTGLFLLVGIDWSTLTPDYRMGVFLGLAAAFAYALFLLVLRKSQSPDDRLSAPANLMIISVLVALIVAVEASIGGESFRIPDRSSLYLMIAYGVFSHGLGWMAISRGLAKVRASRGGLILLLQPPVTFVWDVLFFGRVVTLPDIIGASAALIAIYLGSTGSSTETRRTDSGDRKAGSQRNR